MTSSTHSPARADLRTRALRATAAGLCLAASLTGLVACSDDDASDDQSSGSGSGATLSTATDRPSIAAQEPSASAQPSATSAGGQLGSRPSDAPDIKPTASWTPPEVHFYNENWDYWYQDDSVTNQDSITSHGNLEGFRTYTGSCVGIATRDINEATYFVGLSDETLSNNLADGSANMDTFTETARERVSLVTDDGGTMEGYNVTYTGTYTWADGPSEVHGYRFARTVSEAGLTFVVMLMCRAGDELTLEQWHEILAGMRLTGVSAGAME